MNVSYYLDNFPSWSWTYHCIQKIVDANLSGQVIGYVDNRGVHLLQFVLNETLGIDRETCNKFCSSTAIQLDFQFQTFAGAFVNYLLPWLGLIAQLPIETEDKYDGFISLFMAVGSPALITYSLMLTIRNRALVRDKFGELREHLPGVTPKYATFGQRLDAIQYVLEEAQQVPLRVSQGDGWFSSLIVAAQNETWWVDLESKLKDTRRGRTLSLVFQMGVAILAWLLTIITAFVSSLGDTSTGLQISAGNIWVWMIPVILGWIRVGTQQQHDSIDKALRTGKAFLARGPPNVLGDGMYTETRDQHGLIVTANKNDSGLTPYTRRELQLPRRSFGRPSSLFDVRGDERRRGPAFNYARTFTYCHLVNTIKKAVDTTMENISEGNTCSGEQNFEVGGHREGLLGNDACTEAYSGLNRPGREIYAYPEWSEVPPEVWKGIGISALLALFLQWGTTGAALMIAYLTPTKGLGCRSGAYLVYGTNATVAWSLLAMSSFFSHSAMLRYQNETQKEPRADSGDQEANGAAVHPNVTMGPDNNTYPLNPIGSSVQPSSSSQLLSSSQPRPSISAAYWNWVPVQVLAPVTRYLGRFLAWANAIFLVAVCLFDFTGGFDNCWCQSDTIGLGNSAMVVLFQTAHDLEKVAGLVWGMGLMLSILVCLVSFGVFWGGM